MYNFFTPTAEMSYFRKELQPWASKMSAFLKVNFSAAAAQTAVCLKETNTAVAAAAAGGGDRLT